MTKSELISGLAKALSQSQIEMRGASKDSKNPFFKSSYADLESVMSVFQEYYAKHGLAVSQFPAITDAGAPAIETILMHESGQFISSTMPLAVAKQNDPQALGSGISYARRYALAAVLGIYQTDDDGEGAMGRGKHEGAGLKLAPRVSPSQPAEDEGGALSGKYIIKFGSFSGRTLPEAFRVFGKDKLERSIELCEEKIATGIPYKGVTIEEMQEYVDRCVALIVAIENGNMEGAANEY